MAKTCPNCGYHPIGPFSDNCPMCAEPVRNVRSGGRGGGGFGGQSNALKLALGGIVAALLLVGGCCGLGIWRAGNAMRDMQKEMVEMQAKAEADRKARTVEVSAADLIKEFHADATAADKKYAGKYLEITGVVERTGGGRRDVPFVVLHGGDENTKVKIECFFDLFNEPDDARVERLAKGDRITLRGEYKGQVSNVQLRECVLVK
jgi:hypothetical protein